MIYIHLFKNFSVCDIAFDFQILNEKPKELHDGKLLELQPGECTYVCRSRIDENNHSMMIFDQYLISNVNEQAQETHTEEFVLRRYE